MRPCPVGSVLFSPMVDGLGCPKTFQRRKTFAPQLGRVVMALFRDEPSVVMVRVAVLGEIRCLQTFSTFGCMEE